MILCDFVLCDFVVIGIYNLDKGGNLMFVQTKNDSKEDLNLKNNASMLDEICIRIGCTRALKICVLLSRRYHVGK